MNNQDFENLKPYQETKTPVEIYQEGFKAGEFLTKQRMQEKIKEWANKSIGYHLDKEIIEDLLNSLGDGQ